MNLWALCQVHNKIGGTEHKMGNVTFLEHSLALYFIYAFNKRTFT